MKNKIFILVLLFVLVSANFKTAEAAKPLTAPRGEEKKQEIKRIENTNRLATTITPGEKGRLQSCESRKEAISTRSTNLTRYTDNIIKTFDKIVNRVKAYYVSSGKSVPNYDSLVAAIETKKATALADNVKAQSIITNFECTVDSQPKTVLKNFNEAMKKVKADLNEYKKAVRNLIVAVKGSEPIKGGIR